MASEAVKKILAAEAASDQKNSEARKRREDILTEAERKASLAVQKRISEASSESAKYKGELDKKAAAYRQNAEKLCGEQVDSIRSQAKKNMDKAIDAVIDRFF
ncbi:MAG: hypothetical protein IJ779_11425 [Ruminococcus sp.]|nr:hypothetical protein [Ruminococcus sp.]